MLLHLLIIGITITKTLNQVQAIFNFRGNKTKLAMASSVVTQNFNSVSQSHYGSHYNYNVSTSDESTKLESNSLEG